MYKTLLISLLLFVPALQAANQDRFQLEDAGFKLVEEAYYIRDTTDDHSKLVFDPTLRGKTDRFIYKFMKL